MPLRRLDGRRRRLEGRSRAGCRRRLRPEEIAGAPSGEAGDGRRVPRIARLERALPVAAAARRLPRRHRRAAACGRASRGRSHAQGVKCVAARTTGADRASSGTPTATGASGSFPAEGMHRGERARSRPRAREAREELGVDHRAWRPPRGASSCATTGVTAMHVLHRRGRATDAADASIAGELAEVRWAALSDVPRRRSPAATRDPRAAWRADQSSFSAQNEANGFSL